MSSLASFDPFATHPFTNNSGLAPQPPKPSKYPRPIPSPPHHLSSNANPLAPSAPASTSLSPPMRSPRPQQGSPGKAISAPSKPIFVPFRQETSSPDIGDIMSKKRSPSSLESKLSSSSGKSA